MRKHLSGFTLIEILIVIVIISIVSGVSLLTLNANQRKQWESSVRKLSSLITLAAQEAMLKPETLGLAFTANAYQFFRFQKNQAEETSPWIPLEDKNLRPQFFPGNTHITLKIDGKEVPLEGQPQIIIAEDGELTPFTLYIGKIGEEPSYELSGKASGEVTYDMYHAK